MAAARHRSANDNIGRLQRPDRRQHGTWSVVHGILPGARRALATIDRLRLHRPQFPKHSSFAHNMPSLLSPCSGSALRSTINASDFARSTNDAAPDKASQLKVRSKISCDTKNAIEKATHRVKQPKQFISRLSAELPKRARNHATKSADPSSFTKEIGHAPSGERRDDKRSQKAPAHPTSQRTRLVCGRRRRPAFHPVTPVVG